MNEYKLEDDDGMSLYQKHVMIYWNTANVGVKHQSYISEADYVQVIIHLSCQSIALSINMLLIWATHCAFAHSRYVQLASDLYHPNT